MKILLFVLYHVGLSLGKPTKMERSCHQHKMNGVGFPFDCQDIWQKGCHKDGEYNIYPWGSQHPLPVYCDMTTNGKVWTVFQKRFDGSVDFNQNMEAYLKGFGNADGEYWLGLQNIYLLTMRAQYELRVELEDFVGTRSSAQYSNFTLSPHALNAEQDGYRLYVDEFTDNGAGDSLSPHVGQKFSTFDKDQEADMQNCAEYWGGGFWYHSNGCANAGLNARYITPSHGRSLVHAFSWSTWIDYPESLKGSQMKMRRIPNTN